MAKKKKQAQAKYNFIGHIYEGLMESAQVTKKGTVSLKRGDVKEIVEGAFNQALKHAGKGDRIRFPVIGSLVRKEVAARKGGVKTTNPFTGEPMVTKSRPATKKPRWSFPKSLKDHFANKKNW